MSGNGNEGARPDQPQESRRAGFPVARRDDHGVHLASQINTRGATARGLGERSAQDDGRAKSLQDQPFHLICGSAVFVGANNSRRADRFGFPSSRELELRDLTLHGGRVAPNLACEGRKQGRLVRMQEQPGEQSCLAVGNGRWEAAMAGEFSCV